MPSLRPTYTSWAFAPGERCSAKIRYAIYVFIFCEWYYYKERDAEKRRQFIEELEKIPERNRVYIDESGVDKYLQRESARAPIGMRIYESISGKRYARESFIAAKVESHIVAPFCYTGTCDTHLFNLWLRDFLLPELQPGQVVIMDNASFHKSQDSQRLIEQAGCRILFLPPYSPDLNPIEVFLANFKRMIQSNLGKFKTLAQVIDFSFSSVVGV